MITQYTRELAQEAHQARSALELGILQDMDSTAKQVGLTSMEIARWACTYCRGPERIESPALDALIAFYRQHIGILGFTGHWTPEKGWS